MDHALKICLALAFCLAPHGARAEAIPVDQIARQVQQLGSAHYRERKQAQAALIALGDKAVQPLKYALQSDNPEATWRAITILETIALHGEQEAADDALAVLEAYGAGGDPEVTATIRQLQYRLVVQRHLDGSRQLAAQGARFEQGQSAAEAAGLAGTYDETVPRELLSYTSDVTEPVDYPSPPATAFSEFGGSKDLKIFSAKVATARPVLDPDDSPLAVEVEETAPGSMGLSGRPAGAAMTLPEPKPLTATLLTPSTEPLEIESPVRADDTVIEETAVERTTIEEADNDAHFREATDEILALIQVQDPSEPIAGSSAFEFTAHEPPHMMYLTAAWRGRPVDLKLLSQMALLTEIQVQNRKLGQDELQQLAAAPGLVRLMLTNCQCPLTALKKIKTDHPQLEVSAFGPAVLGVSADLSEPVRSPFQVGVLASGHGAEAAGVKIGDQITAVDGEPIADFFELTFALASRRVGERVKLSIVREGKPMSLTAQLGSSTPTYLPPR
ncbi:PDZ domain-containing protein [Lignipirellula cremea]|uniref:Periplasmic pH-dependent serine endoprotease DegQ n=1 Tax=Lignipirellula cremea TaxID=2528010 RepID=A0A518DTX8_9BACT|nr:PDZ domain-containing protein [Lignipirellula cremea]QDU95300.1 Periplasmic pH-dependent serine endoprotease DegQ precursor [Lignipirellula cremea]